MPGRLAAVPGAPGRAPVPDHVLRDPFLDDRDGLLGDAFEVERLGKSGDLATARAAAMSLAQNLETLIVELQSFLQVRS